MLINIPKRKDKLLKLPHYLRDTIFKYDYYFARKEQILLSFYENVKSIQAFGDKVIAVVQNSDFDENIKVWSTIDGRLLKHKILDTNVRRFKIIDDSIIFIDPRLNIWDIEIIRFNNDYVYDIDVLDRKIGVCYSDYIKIFHFDTKEFEYIVSNDQEFKEIRFFSDGRVIGYSSNGLLKIWSPDLQCLYTCSCHPYHGLYILDITKDNNVIYITKKGQIAILNTQTYTTQVLFEYGAGTVQVFNNLLILHIENRLTVYDLISKNKESKRLKSHIKSVSVLPNNQLIILLENEQLINVVDRRIIKKDISSFNVLSDGRIIGLEKNKLKIWI